MNKAWFQNMFADIWGKSIINLCNFSKDILSIIVKATNFVNCDINVFANILAAVHRSESVLYIENE